MRLILIFPLIFLQIQSLPIEDDQEITQAFCGNYAQCRSLAKSQFENCVGGFMQMVLTQSQALSGFKDKAQELSHKCEKDLVEAIEQDIKPFYEKIERETFECTQEKTDPKAFNLDESQKIECKLIQTEVKAESFTITGANNDDECKAVYESQLQRCDLIKNCCPQFHHCRMKAEIENGAHNKEEKLAKRFEHCLEKQDVDYHPVTSEPLPVAPEAEETSTEVHEITIEKRGAPEKTEIESTTPVSKKSDSPATPPIAAGPTLATLPPPDKVFNDLVGLLFPGLTTTPKPTTPKPTTPEPTTSKPTTVPVQKVEKEEKKMSEAKEKRMKEFQSPEYQRLLKKGKFQKSEPKVDQKKNDQTKQQSSSHLPSTVPSTHASKKKDQTKQGKKPRHPSKATGKKEEKVKHSTTASSSPPSKALSKDSSKEQHKKVVNKQELKHPSTSSSTSSSTLPSTSSSTLPSTSSSTLPSTASNSSKEVEILSKMFCEQYLECQEVVEKQYKLCDENYQSESALYGIQDHSLRSEFIKNSQNPKDNSKY